MLMCLYLIIPRVKISHNMIKFITTKQMALEHKNFEIAREREKSLKDVSSYDLLSFSALFEGDAAAKPAKSMLIGELEFTLSSELCVR